MNHIVRDYFLEHKDYFDYTYDEMENYGHEWKFWNIELKNFSILQDFVRSRIKYYCFELVYNIRIKTGG